MRESLCTMGQALEGHGALPRHVSKQEQFEVDREKTSHEQSHHFHASIPIRVGRTAPLRAYLASIVMFFISLAATLCIPVQGYSQAGAPNTPESDKRLYVRLEAAVSTTTSHLHQPVTARVVRDFATSQGVLVPTGSKVTGRIEKLIPPSDPNDHARMLIRFDQVVIPRHPAIDLDRAPDGSGERSGDGPSGWDYSRYP